jgi:hypothetical protein
MKNLTKLQYKVLAIGVFKTFLNSQRLAENLTFLLLELQQIEVEMLLNKRLNRNAETRHLMLNFYDGMNVGFAALTIKELEVKLCSPKESKLYIQLFELFVNSPDRLELSLSGFNFKENLQCEVKVLASPVTERYCNVGDVATLDKATNQIRCGGVWFAFDDRWKVDYL